MPDLYVEVSEGVVRSQPAQMAKESELEAWLSNHQNSTRGLFSSIFRYPTIDPYVGGVLSDFFLDSTMKQIQTGLARTLFWS